MEKTAIGAQHRYRVELVTMQDVRNFVNIASKCKGKLLLSSGKDFQINAQSMLGVILAKHLNWSELTLITEYDCYKEFEAFIAE